MEVPSESRRLNALPAIAGGRPVRPSGKKLIFGAPLIDEEEIESVSACLRSRWLGRGQKVERFETEFAKLKGAPHAVALNSGTSALLLGLLSVGVGSGDEVITPSMTFCSTAHAVLHTGAKPVLVDCDLQTYNVDADLIAAHITSRTKAIVVVHMGGRCCEMAPVMHLARRFGLRVIEDCAHAIEATNNGHPAGCFGDAGCFSFYPTKSITTGDGGMLVTADRLIAQRVRTLAAQGMTSDAWNREERANPEYRVVSHGFKANMTDIEASLGLPQLKKLDQKWRRRSAIWHAYDRSLRDLPLQLPAPTDSSSLHAHHLYSVALQIDPNKLSRAKFAAALKAENIGTGVHYVPVHLQPYYRRRFAYSPSAFPKATWLGRRTVSLPLTADLTDEDVNDVVRACWKIFSFYAPNEEKTDSEEFGCEWNLSSQRELKGELADALP